MVVPLSFLLFLTILSAALVDTPDLVKQFVKDMANHPEFQGEWFDFFRVYTTLNTFDLDVLPFVIQNMKYESEGEADTTSQDPPDLSDSESTDSQDSDRTIGPAYTVSELERAWYYYGIAHNTEHPELLYRTSWENGPWWTPSGSSIAHPPTKFARPVHNTTLNRVWHILGPEIDELVNTAVKRSYSINTARFWTVPDGEDGTLGPVVIWISVYPGSTSVNIAHEVSQDILQLLADNNVSGVEVEWCEGITSRLFAPLLPAVGKRDPTALPRHHLTTALSIPIAADSMAKDYIGDQGTGGFYFHENLDQNGNPSDKVLLVTNRHVVCKQDHRKYDFRTSKSLQRIVRVCGLFRFQEVYDEIRVEVVRHGRKASACANEITHLKAKLAKGGGDKHTTESLGKALQEIDEHREAIIELEKFYNLVGPGWIDFGCRGIGALEYSPPISVDVDNESYTQDWATIRLQGHRFKPNFMGNIIDLGKLDDVRFQRLMDPRADSKPVVEYPPEGLLRIGGFVTKEQLANPKSLDLNGEPCLFVLKDGCASNLTVGRYAGLESFLCDEKGVQSVELAVYNYDKESKPFSLKGDSGSLIVNGRGDMVGLLHSGMRKNQMDLTGTYITYATPAWRLLGWIKEVYPHADFTRETW